MRCVKCGYVSFDHLDSCKKCGTDLTSVRTKLNLFDVVPDPPRLLDELVRRLESAAIPEAERVAEDEGGDVDLLDRIDFSPEASEEEGEEITLELLDEEEEKMDDADEEIALQLDLDALADDEGMVLATEDMTLEKPEVDPSMQEDDLGLAVEDEDAEESDAVILDVETEELAEEALKALQEELEKAQGLMDEISLVDETTASPEEMGDEIGGGDVEETIPLQLESDGGEGEVSLADEEGLPELTLDLSDEETVVQGSPDKDETAGSELQLDLDLSDLSDEGEEQGDLDEGGLEIQWIEDEDGGLIIEPDLLVEESSEERKDSKGRKED